MDPMHRGTTALLVGVPVLTSLLACGGIWQEAVAESFSEMTIELERAVPASDAHRATVQAHIDDGWIAAWEGHIGLIDSVAFSVELEATTLDGRFSDGELALLEEKANGFDDHPVSAERRADLLLIKAEMDNKTRLDHGTGGPRLPGGELGTAGALASWELPDDLRVAAEGAGWTLTGCSDDIDEQAHWVSCSGERGPNAAEFAVSRFKRTGDAREFDPGQNSVRDGGTLLEVSVLDGDAALRVRDAVLPPSAAFSDLDPKRVRSAIQGTDDNYKLRGCEHDKEGGQVWVNCTAYSDAHEVDVSLDIARGGRGRTTREVEGGMAFAYQGDSALSVIVVDKQASDTLISQMVP